MPFEVLLEDVQALLASKELAAAQEKVVSAINSRVIAERFATPYQKSLLNAQIPVAEIIRLVAEEEDLLVRFVVRHLSAPVDPADVDGEFPVGEERDPAERSRTVAVLGHENGFLLQQAIYLLLARRGRDHLLRYLRWQRIPFAQRVCRELLQHLDSASHQL